MTFKNQLKKLDACSEAKKWVGNKTIEEAWRTCKNPHWVLWVLVKADLDLIDPICDIAEGVLHLVPEEYQLACIWAISAARRRASKDELDAASYAANNAFYHDSVDDVYVSACTNATINSRAAADAAAKSAANAAEYVSALYDGNIFDISMSIYSTSGNAISAIYYAVGSTEIIAKVRDYTDACNKENKKQCNIIRGYFNIEQVKESFNKLVS